MVPDVDELLKLVALPLSEHRRRPDSARRRPEWSVVAGMVCDEPRVTKAGPPLRQSHHRRLCGQHDLQGVAYPSGMSFVPTSGWCEPMSGMD
jgi:hypothetical protein